ncbi:hypothetical protein B1B04_08365 [Lysinibacillus sp. KCTC 33748]|uniref:hypothetical protein n=1 Tax=unclassified Lysinibacillus TaxID=2636778 RepID=UPI0009A595A9|nr:MULTISPECIES: hypothetical protein [unclassified Lysinibacillus]OXS74894.1 hypothetical protein B1B04_08365 [Lysinibacillus sp. KCTC 33748]
MINRVVLVGKNCAKYISLVCGIVWTICLIQLVTGSNFSNFIVGLAFLNSSVYFLRKFTVCLTKEGNSN